MTRAGRVRAVPRHCIVCYDAVQPEMLQLKCCSQVICRNCTRNWLLNRVELNERLSVGGCPNCHANLDSSFDDVVREVRTQRDSMLTDARRTMLPSLRDVTSFPELLSLMWKLFFTNRCPRCYRQIFKDGGCPNMYCPPPCGRHFVWSSPTAWLINFVFCAFVFFLAFGFRGGNVDVDASNNGTTPFNMTTTPPLFANETDVNKTTATTTTDGTVVGDGLDLPRSTVLMAGATWYGLLFLGHCISVLAAAVIAPISTFEIINIPFTIGYAGFLLYHWLPLISHAFGNISVFFAALRHDLWALVAAMPGFIAAIPAGVFSVVGACLNAAVSVATWAFQMATLVPHVVRQPRLIATLVADNPMTTIAVVAAVGLLVVMAVSAGRYRYRGSPRNHHRAMQVHASLALPPVHTARAKRHKRK